MRIFANVVVILFFLLSGCTGQHPARVTDESGVAYPLPLPAVYSADLPCDECSNRKVFLTLEPDGRYFLRISTIKKDATEDEVKAEFGIWKYVSAGNTIDLTSYADSRKSLVITPDKKLRLLSVSGGLSVIKENTVLQQDPDNPGYSDSVPLLGRYLLVDDTATFTECLTGKTFPLIRKGHYAGLEQAYKVTPHGQDEPLLVSIDGRFVAPADEDGVGYAEAVLPVHFLDIRPGLECNGEKTSVLSLTDNTWSLVELLGKPIKLRKGQNRPYLTLSSKGKRVAGFGGCNRFTGTYFMLGDVFLFNKRIGTRMACVDCMDLEFTYYKILSATDGYHIEGNILEFRDRDRNVLAKFEHAGAADENMGGCRFVPGGD